ncbi:MAG TPA: ATP-grasp domain-containing protein [Longimicrobiales bacterium]
MAETREPVRVLVTGAGALLGQGVIRSLLDSDRGPFEVIAADPSPLSAGLYWTDERYLLPLAAAPDFVDAVEELIARTRPDVVIPGTDVELMPLALQRARLEAAGTHVLVASPDVVRIADDKYETARFFAEHGFEPPASCLPGGEDELLRTVDFPLIVKPRRGARSVGVRKVFDRTALARAIAETDEPVIQDCIGDDAAEYTAGTITFGGRCEAAIVMRRDLRDGNTYRAFVEQSETLLADVRAFAEALGAHGPANFQFRLVDGRPRVFEINARFSGTTPLRALAGFDEVGMCIDHLLRGQPVTQPAVRDVTILRHWSETVLEPGTVPPTPVRSATRA